MSFGKTGLCLVVIVQCWTACRMADSWDKPARCGSVTFWSFAWDDTVTLSMSSSIDYEGRLVVIDVPAKDTTIVPNDLTKATFNKFCIKDIQTEDTVVMLQLWDTVHHQYDVCSSWTGHDPIELYNDCPDTPIICAVFPIFRDGLGMVVNHRQDLLEKQGNKQT